MIESAQQQADKSQPSTGQRQQYPMYYGRQNPPESSANGIHNGVPRQSVISTISTSSYAPTIERQLNSLVSEEYTAEVLQNTFDQLDAESVHQPSLHQPSLHHRPNPLHPSNSLRATSPSFNSNTTDSAPRRSSVNDNTDDKSVSGIIIYWMFVFAINNKSCLIYLGVSKYYVIAMLLL
jgi:hypothetical protein